MLWLAIANLNIFGMGYWLSGKHLRGLFYLVLGILLLAAGHWLNASNHPLLWGVLYLVLFTGAAVDMWRLLKEKWGNPAPFFQRPTPFLPALAILANLVFYGGFLTYRSLGSNLYQSGLTAYEKNDVYGAFGNWYTLSKSYRLSLNPQVVEAQQSLGEVGLLINTRNLLDDGQFNMVLDEINRFHALYPSSLKETLMADMGIDAYLGWVQELSEQNKYEEGLDKLNSVEVAFPVHAQARQKQLNDAYSAHYLAWGNYLITQNAFETAMEKLEYLMDTYPDTVEYKTAYDSIAQANLGWSEQLITQKDYKQAVSKLQIVVDDYNESAAVTQAGQLLPQAYLDWSKALSNQQRYLLSMEKLEAIEGLNASGSLLDDVEVAYQNTVLLLARDNGEDGKAVLAEALSQACSGEIPSHPSVGLLVDEPGKILNCCGVVSTGGCVFWSIPKNLAASTPGSFRYIVVRKHSTKVVQNCPYTGGATMERLQEVEEVVITSVASGEVVAEKTFYGGYPPTCPIVHSFQSSTASIMGDQISNPTINEWISQVVK